MKKSDRKILTFIGGLRDPDAPKLLQIANVDSGEIHWMHGEEVTEIVSKYRKLLKSLLLLTNKYINSSNSNIKNSFENALMPIASK
tara:strand:- start:228 stop:485 length:258 start_codon:yes stop_codon:yes gene_type:complete